MTDSPKFESSLSSFLDEGPSVLSDRVVQAVMADVHRAPQRKMRSPWAPGQLPFAAVAASALVAVGVAAFAIGWATGRLGPSVGDGPSVVPSPSSAASTPVSPEPSASMLPNRGLPGMNPNEPAGEYGWTGTLGDFAGMHKVVTVGDGDSRETQLTFAIADDCFAYGIETEPVPVTVAGLNGLYVEPYGDPAVLFINRGQRSKVTTGAYALAIGDRTLCVYLTWEPETTPDELEAARQVVESIRGQPYGERGIRINFTLPAEWDTG